MNSPNMLIHDATATPKVYSLSVLALYGARMQKNKGRLVLLVSTLLMLIFLWEKLSKVMVDSLK